MFRMLAALAISILILAAYNADAQDQPEAAQDVPESLRQLPEATPDTPETAQQAPETAQQAPENAGGRYRMSEVEGGFLRLDTQDGEVSFCHQQRGDWVCELVADDREAYEAEIGRLAEENQRLQDELAALEEHETGRNVIELPDSQDVDRFVAFLDQMMRRLFDMVKSFTEQGSEERTSSSQSGPWIPPLTQNTPDRI